MNFESRIVLQPEAFPGVKIVLNKMTEGRRINLRLRMSELSSKLREFSRRTKKLKEGAIEATERELHLTLKKLRAMGDDSKFPDVYESTLQAATDLAEKLSTLPGIDEVREIEQQTAELIEDRFTPEWVRWGVKSIEGLEIDGQPATVETLIQDGPRELYSLIAAEIQRAAGLSGVESGESAPRITSGESADTRMNGSTAEPAGEKGTTSPETVPATFPS